MNKLKKKIFSFRHKFMLKKNNIKCKLFTRYKIKSISNVNDLLKSMGKCSLENFIRDDYKSDSLCIFLISHSFDRTGSPTALFYLALYLKKLGYRPVMLSSISGEMVDELKSEKIEYMVLPLEVLEYFKFVIEKNIKMLVFCTIYTAPILQFFNGMNIPVSWWLHDASKYYTSKVIKTLPDILAENIEVYTGGEIAEKALKNFRNYKTQELLFATPEIPEKYEDTSHKYSILNGKFVFAVLGNKCLRKGQDLMLNALDKIAPNIKKQCAFVFIGKAPEKSFSDVYYSLIKKNKDYVYDFDQVSLDELYYFINNVMDCLVCPSREEPMSIVACNAFQYGKPVICSETTGFSKYVKIGNCGIVHRNLDIEDIAKSMSDIFKLDEDARVELKERALRTYYSFFSYDSFQKNVSDIMLSRISN